MKCLWQMLTLCIILVAVTELVSAGGGIPGDIDPETAEILDRYVKMRRISPFGYMGGLPSWINGPQKRNSELINSILGLPKEMNNAGRKK